MAQRPSVASELYKAAQAALESDDSGLSNEIKARATEMVLPTP